MKRILFACDLDNTLLFSRSHFQETPDGASEGTPLVCVEFLDGKEQGFFSQRSIALLRKVIQHICFVPVTTRSVEQYRRITWPEGCQPALALTCNGAILLEQNEPDATWLAESGCRVAPFMSELRRLHALLELDGDFLRCRMVDDMFLFARCTDNVNAKDAARKYQELTTDLTAQHSGKKLYFFPPELDKGSALARLWERKNFDELWCAGDSEMDAPMLRQAHLALIPSEFPVELTEVPGRRVVVYGRDIQFAEQILQHVLNEAFLRQDLSSDRHRNWKTTTMT